MLNVKNLLRAAVLGVLLSTAVPAAASAATGSVSGTATAASTGNPVAGYTVELYDAGRAPAGSTCTDASGAYRFANLATGTYYVRFSGDPAAGCATTGFAASWFDGRAAGKFATAVAVTDGVATPRINGSLQDEATISGRATDAESGSAIANVSVRVLDSDLIEAGRACTTADGSYRVRRLNAFPYLVRFVSDGSCGAVAGYPSRAYSTDDPRGVASDAGGSAVAPFYGQDLPGISILLSLVRHTLGVTVTGPGSVTGGGIACPGTCSTQAPAGNSVTLTPVTPAGSTFTGWTGACAAAGVGPCTVKLDADRTAGATFATVGGGGVPGGGDGGAPGGGAPAGGGGGAGGGGAAGGGAGTATPPVATTPAPVVAPIPSPAGPVTGAPKAKAKCTVARPSKVKKGRFGVTVRCDRRASLVVGGTVSVKSGRKTTKVRLATTRSTASKKTVTLRLPAKAARALRSKKRLTVAVSVRATTAGGTTTAASRATRLR